MAFTYSQIGGDQTEYRCGCHLCIGNELHQGEQIRSTGQCGTSQGLVEGTLTAKDSRRSMDDTAEDKPYEECNEWCKEEAEQTLQWVTDQ